MNRSIPHDVVQQLSVRLPELEWKMNALGLSLNPNILPRGLFKGHQGKITAQSCIHEIKNDLEALIAQRATRANHYVAVKISQKIDVLVKLCQLSQEKESLKKQVTVRPQTISTRQQWIDSLLKEMASLIKQREALSLRLSTLREEADSQMILGVQAELGALERQLTEVTESVKRCQHE